MDVRVKIETEVTLDLDMMAKAFAHMASDEQAKFFAKVHYEMTQYTAYERDGSELRTLGSSGRQMQMLSIKDHFKDTPDANEFIRELYEMTQPAPKTYTVERPKIDGGVEMLTGLSADEVLELRVLDKARICESKDYSLPWDRAAAAADETAVQVMNRTRQVPADDVMTTQILHLSMPSESGTRVSTGQMRTVVRIRGPRYPKPNYRLGDTMQIDGHLLGRVTTVHADGTVSVTMDSPPEPVDFPLSPKGACTCNAKPGEFHKDGCGKMKALDDNDIENLPSRPPIEQCAECKGTGYWENPAGGRNHKSPCSLGCKPA